MAATSNFSTLSVSNAVRELSVEQTRQLVFQLGVEINVLDDIADRYEGENRKQHFVRKWLEVDVNASWKTLVNGLRIINMNAVAAEIESAEHDNISVISGSSTTHTGSTTVLTTPSGVSAPVKLGIRTADNSTISLAVFKQKVHEATASIEYFKDEFSDLIVEAQLLLSKKENENPYFFVRFRTHIRVLPVSKRSVHIRFFSRNQKEIKIAQNVDDLFNILILYCTYYNYEIILHIIKKFCPELRNRMLSYHDTLIAFEKKTTVDVYLRAISARPGGIICNGFIRMTAKINKPPSECTLHEVRVLKESIEEEASLEPYAVYIETPGVGSVHVGLWFHEDVCRIVGTILTPEFVRTHLLTNLTMSGVDINTFMNYLSAHSSNLGVVKSVEEAEHQGLELMLAVGLGWKPMVCPLLESGANTDLQKTDGNTALVIATKEGNTELVSLLLDAGANPDIQNKNGDTALVIATKEGNTELVSLLVDAGASPDIQNKCGCSALMIAIMEGNNAVFTLLLETGANIELQNESGGSALIVAAKVGKTEFVPHLLQAGANINLQDTDGESALLLVADSVRLVRLLLDSGANLDLQNKMGETVLMKAIRWGLTEVVQTVLDAKPSLHLQNKIGDSALIMAIRWGRIDVVSLLIEAAANTDIQNKRGDSALSMAILLGYIEVISLLIKAGANPDLQDKEGDSALMMAMGENLAEIVSLLLEVISNINLQNKKGDSALMMATASCNLPILKELLRAGADPNLQNEEGLTALIISAILEGTKLTETLLSKRNIAIDIRSSTGWSALFFAAEGGDIAKVKLLLKAGANPSLTDQSGLTVEAIAAANDYEELYKLLSRYIGGPAVPLGTRVTQGLREAVKNTGRWAKQAFIRLEVRVMRPTKLKIKQLESGSDGKEPISKLSGADTHSPLSPEEEYLSSLDGQEHHDF